MIPIPSFLTGVIELFVNLAKVFTRFIARSRPTKFLERPSLAAPLVT